MLSNFRKTVHNRKTQRSASDLGLRRQRRFEYPFASYILSSQTPDTDNRDNSEMISDLPFSRTSWRGFIYMMRCKSPTDKSLSILATALSSMLPDKPMTWSLPTTSSNRAQSLQRRPPTSCSALGKFLWGRTLAASNPTYLASSLLFLTLLILRTIGLFGLSPLTCGGIWKAYPARLSVLASGRVSC